VNFRSRPFLDLAYNFPCYLRLPCCEGGDAGEPAHSNNADHGKGGGMKAHDVFTVPACRSCHREFDQGRTLTLEERRNLWQRAFNQYLPDLFRSGWIRIATAREQARIA